MDAINTRAGFTDNSIGAGAPGQRAASLNNARDVAGSTAVEGTRAPGEQTPAAGRQSETTSRQSELANVVSISADGDTLQVDPSTEERARRESEGRMTARTDAEEARRASQEEAAKRREEIARQREERMQAIAKAQEEARASQEEEDAQEITSFAGYTTAQIEQLYAQGRISQYNYDQQMSARQEARDQSQAQSQEFSNEQARLNGTLTRDRMTSNAIETAFSVNASDNTPAEARIDAMQRIQDANTQQNQTQADLRNSEGRRTWDYQLQA